MGIAIENLDRIRLRKGLTITQISSLTGYSKNSINKLLSMKDDYKIRLDIVVSVSRVLNVDFPLIFSRGLKNYGVYNHDYTTERYLEIFTVNVKKKLSKKSYVYLTAMTGISESTISDLLNLKTKNPRLETVIKIAKGLKVAEKELFSEVN